MKSPPQQFTDYEARQKVEEFIKGEDQQTQQELFSREMTANVARIAPAKDAVIIDRSN